MDPADNVFDVTGPMDPPGLDQALDHASFGDISGTDPNGILA